MYRIKEYIKLWIIRSKYRKLTTAINSSSIGENFKIGEYSTVNENTIIFNNVSIGDFTYCNSITRGIVIDSNVEIGSFVSIAPGVSIAYGNHRLDYVTTHPILYTDSYIKKIPGNGGRVRNEGLVDKNVKTIIGNDVWIGADSIIKRGVRVGNGVVIGAGSVVTKDIPNYAIVAGNPAKIIRFRFSEEILTRLNSLPKQFWELEVEELKLNIEKLYSVEDYIAYMETMR